MKAISLWQPWASAIATGAKRIETRSWPTSYRGPLAIHAAKRLIKGEMFHYSCCWNWCGALGREMGKGATFQYTLPFGAIVAVVDLVDCRPTDSFTVSELDKPRGEHPYQWMECQLGDFSPGRYGWVLENVRAIMPPVPLRGQRGLWDVESELLK